MSELKAFELKAGKNLETDSPLVVGVDNKWNSRVMSGDEVYIKSEADKVIAELKEKLKEQTSIAEEGWKEFRIYHTSYAEAVKELYEKNKELRHQKYKRCLAMAEACRHKRWRGGIGEEGYDYARATRHMNVWLELAEKFKEGK